MNVAVASFAVPTVIEYGAGAITRLAQICNHHDTRSVFAIVDGNIPDRDIISSLIPAQTEICYHTGEPTTADVDRLARATQNPDLIVAVGGGSVIDLAKAVRALIPLPGSILDYEGIDTIAAAPPCPLVAVPTTAGTGADLTAGSVIVDQETRRKYIVAGAALLPDYSLSDYELTLTVPPQVTAETGFDALAQAIGAATSSYAQMLSDPIALSAIGSAATNLPVATGNGNSRAARAGMMYASVAAGVAMSIADCVADHFFAEVVGAYYGIRHGLSVALFLPEVMAYNLPATPEKMALIAKAMGEDISGQSPGSAGVKAVDAVARLRDLLDLPSARDLGCSVADIPELAARTVDHIGVELGLNPRPITRESAVNIYAEVFAR